MTNNHDCSNDVKRLYDALGVDASDYVSLPRRRRPVAEAIPPRVESAAPDKGTAEAAQRSQAGSAPRPVADAGQMSGYSGPSLVPADPLRTAEAGTLRAFLARGKSGNHRKFGEMVRISMVSIAGGTGKTTFSGILASLLASRNHSVLLADYSRHNCMHGLLGSPDQFGPVSFPIAGAGIMPVPMVSLYPKGKRLDDFPMWLQLISRSAQFIFLDGMEDPIAAAKDTLDDDGLVLVPVLPDVASLLSVRLIDESLQGPASGGVFYFLNRFDPARAQHLQVRDTLRQTLGTRLIPLVIADHPCIQEAATRPAPLTETTESAAVFSQLNELADWVERAAVEKVVTADGVFA